MTYFIFFAIFNSFTIIEAVTAPLIKDIKMNVTTDMNYEYYMVYVVFIASGFVALIAYILHKNLFTQTDNLKKYDDHKKLAMALFLQFVGSMIIIDYSR